MNETFTKLQQEVKKLSSNVGTIEDNISNMRATKREQAAKISQLETELAKLENVRSKKLEWLRRVNQQAYNATMWLRENKGMFRGNVYEPIVLEVCKKWNTP